LRGLVGCEHPDVEALSLECPDSTLRSSRPLRAPPIFERSWRILVKASLRSDPKLIPLSLWQQVHATLSAPPFLLWATDTAVQLDFRSALAGALYGPKEKSLRGSALPQNMSAGPPGETATREAEELQPTGLKLESLERLVSSGASGSLAQFSKRVDALGLPAVALAALYKEHQSVM
jgi:hypothetical protein